MRLVILGPPGSGKGTQSKRIVRLFDIPQISTGDILRQAVRDGAELGTRAKVYMDTGELVPDALMAELVMERLEQDDCRQGFVLDGFPRTLSQAETLDALLDKKDMAVDAVLDLQVEDAAVIQRLSNRRLCSRCGADYNMLSNPPKQKGLCDRCGGDLYQREDDREETISRRLLVYHQQTKPLEAYYRGKGILAVLDAGQDVEELSETIAQRLKQLSASRSAEGLS